MKSQFYFSIFIAIQSNCSEKNLTCLLESEVFFLNHKGFLIHEKTAGGSDTRFFCSRFEINCLKK